MCHTDILYPVQSDFVSFVLLPPDNVSELKPKSGVDEDNSESIFLIRYSVSFYLLSCAPVLPQSHPNQLSQCCQSILHSRLIDFLVNFSILKVCKFQKSYTNYYLSSIRTHSGIKHTHQESTAD